MLLLCNYALLHGFNHIHLDLNYFGAKGISSG
jgi:hypothetical protein